MGAYNPPLEKGFHFSRKDKLGRTAFGWLGAMNIDIGIGMMLLVSDDGRDYFPITPLPMRLWYTEADMRQEINDEYGGTGNFYFGKRLESGIIDPTKRGIVFEAQPLIDKVFDPTPPIPDHANTDIATVDVINDIGAIYLKAPEDPTFTDAPQLVFKPKP